MARPRNWSRFLKKLRSDHGLRTQADAAAKLRISLRTWQNWEQGRTRPDVAAIRLMEITFGLKILDD